MRLPPVFFCLYCTKTFSINTAYYEILRIAILRFQ